MSNMAVIPQLQEVFLVEYILVDKYADWPSGWWSLSLPSGCSVAATPGLRGGSKGKGTRRGTTFEQGQGTRWSLLSVYSPMIR